MSWQHLVFVIEPEDVCTSAFFSKSFQELLGTNASPRINS